MIIKYLINFIAIDSSEIKWYEYWFFNIVVVIIFSQCQYFYVNFDTFGKVTHAFQTLNQNMFI